MPGLVHAREGVRHPGRPDGVHGHLHVAVGAVLEAHRHREAGHPAILYTKGNLDCHVILRGGKGAPNYRAEAVEGALAMLRAANLPERLVIDASHDNSAKDHQRQPVAAEAVSAQLAGGNRAIVGLMLESFLVAGRQEVDRDAPLTYGQSITDACMDWDMTSEVLDGLAEAVRARRAG